MTNFAATGIDVPDGPVAGDVQSPYAAVLMRNGEVIDLKCRRIDLTNRVLAVESNVQVAIRTHFDAIRARAGIDGQYLSAGGIKASNGASPLGGKVEIPVGVKDAGVGVSEASIVLADVAGQRVELADRAIGVTQIPNKALVVGDDGVRPRAWR